MGLFSLEKLFGMTIRESANDGSDFTNPDADYRRLFLGEDGQLHVKDSVGAVTDIGGAVADILDLPTAETDTSLRLAPDGAGGVEFAATTGGGATLYHDTTTRTVTNTVTETNVFPNQSIVGGTLGTTGGFRVTLIANLNHGATGVVTVRIKHGTTVLASIACREGLNAASKPVMIQALIVNLGAENSQAFAMSVVGQDGTGASASYTKAAIGTSAADTATTGNFSITAQWDSANSGLTYTQSAALVEVLTP